MDNGIYAAPFPYPSADGAEHNVRFASTNVEPMRQGEFGAISEYVYQSIIFGDRYPWISTALEGIAITEMRHFELLSELELNMGLNPVINARVRTPVIDISEDTDTTAPRAARRALTNDLNDERKAATEYEQAAQMSRDPVVSSVLNRIAEDEKKHASLLASLLNRLQQM